MNDARCAAEKAKYGFFVDVGPDKRRWLYVPLGVDPKDGCETTAARPMTSYESYLYEYQRMDKLTEVLLLQGVPLPVPATMLPPPREKRTFWEKAKSQLARLFGGRKRKK